VANGRHDIRFAISAPRHVKTKKLIRLTGYEGFYRLLCLWTYAAENHIDGVFPSEDDIEFAVEWSGEPGKFLAALKECRWLEPDGVTLHDWAEEQPYIAQREARVESARRAGQASAASRESQRTVERSVDDPLTVGSTLRQPQARPGQTRPDPPTEQPSPPPPATEGAPKVHGPAETLARAGKAKCGGGLDKWREQIGAIRRFGVPDEKIAALIEEKGCPGMPPWDFAKLVTGYAPPSNRPQPTLMATPAPATLPAGAIAPRTREEAEAAEAIAKKRREEEDAKTRERMSKLGSLTDRLSRRWGTEKGGVG
jgi:hypothetical protein